MVSQGNDHEGARPMNKLLRRCLHDVKGATAIEYALLAAFIGGALVIVMPSISSKLNGTMTTVADNIGGGSSGPGRKKPPSSGYTPPPTSSLPTPPPPPKGGPPPKKP